MHIRARRLVVNDRDALQFERALENCSTTLQDCVNNVALLRRPPPPFDVTFRRHANLTVPAGVSVVALEVAGAGGGHSTSAYESSPPSAPGGDSACLVAGVSITARGGTSSPGKLDGEDGAAEIVDPFQRASASSMYAVTGAGGAGGVPSGPHNGGRGGNGGLAGAHVAVSAGDTIVCTAGARGINQHSTVCGQDSSDGWVRVRW